MSEFESFFIGYDVPPSTCIIGHDTPGFKLTEQTLKTHMHRSWQAAVEATKAAVTKQIKGLHYFKVGYISAIDMEEALKAIRETEVQQWYIKQVKKPAVQT